MDLREANVSVAQGAFDILMRVCLCALLCCAMGCASSTLNPNYENPASAADGRAVRTPPKKIVAGKSEISTNFGWIRQVAWSPDSKLFAVIQATKKEISIVVFDAKTKKIVKALSPRFCGPYSGETEVGTQGDVSFSPDGRYLAGGVGIITLWDAKTWQPVRDILGPFSRGANAASEVSSIAFSPDSKSLAILYRSVLYPETLRSDGFEDARAIAQRRKTDRSISNDATLMVFDVETATRQFFVKNEHATDIVNKFSRMFTGGVSYSPDGKHILTSHVGGIRNDFLTKDDDPSKYYTQLVFRDAKTGKALRDIHEIHAMRINASVLSHNGKLVATGTDTGSKESTKNLFTNQWFPLHNTDPIRIWDVASGSKLMELGPLRGAVKMLAFSPDDRVLISCQTDIKEKETIWIWDLASGQLIERVHTPRSGHEFFSCALSPDGRTLAMPVMDKIYLVHIKQ